MKKTIFISFALLFLVFSGCRAKKEVTKSETIKIDSVYINRSEVVFAPLASALTINDLCDTITGKARPFKSELIRGKDTIFIEVAGNALNLSIDLDSLVNTRLETERKRWEKYSEKKEITVYKTPKWAWWTMAILLGAVILFIVFPVVPRWVRGLFPD